MQLQRATVGLSACFPPPSGLRPLTNSEARRVVLNACQVQVMVPALQVLIHTVALAARLGVVVTVVAPEDTSRTTGLADV